jgi:hypothetical protein
LIHTNTLELIEVNRLVPYINNTRTHSEEQILKLRSSIREFGFINPVLIDKDYGIIAGHGRVEAAKAEGIEKVPCVRVEHLSEAQKKAYMIADNRLAEGAGWDMEMLKIELENLQELNFDIALTGFADFELGGFTGPNETYEDDYEVRLPAEPKSKVGQVYRLGRHRLMCGDSTDPDAVRKLMGGAKADMVFTDPPWNVNYGAVDEDNAQGYKPRTILNDFMGTKEFREFMEQAFNCMSQISKPGCMTYVVMSAQEWGSLMAAMAENGYHWSSTIIWNKDSLVLSRKDYHTKYEPIWYGWLEGEGRLHPLEDRKQSDIWDIERPKVSVEHPTMKPVSLVGRAIGNSSAKDDLILDLFGR